VLPDRLVLAASTSPTTPSPIPTYVCAAIADPNWCTTMLDEYGALTTMGPESSSPGPCGSNIIIDNWVFAHKLSADGSFDCYKSHWVLSVSLSALVSTTMRLSARL
jgi:hypothetical protein